MPTTHTNNGGSSGAEILRSAQNDGRFAQNDGRFAQNDGRSAQNDGRAAQNDRRSAQNDGRAAQNDGSAWLFYALLAILVFTPLPYASNRPMYWAFSEIAILAIFSLWLLTTATGTFINRNHLAGYLEMTLAVGLGLLIADLSRDGSTTWRQSLRRWINTLLGPKARVRICLALMVTGLILTQSRMGNAAFFTAMMLAGIVGLIIFRRSSRSVILLFSSLIIIDTFLMGAFFGIDKLQKRIEKTDMSTDASVHGSGTARLRDREWLGRRNVQLDAVHTIG